MRRLPILSVSLGLLSSFGPVLTCSGEQAPQSSPSPQTTPQVKDTPLSARSTASQTKVSDLDLLQKGYFVIGSVSLDWRFNQSEVSEPGIPAAALMAEAERLMAEVASTTQNPAPAAPAATASLPPGWQQYSYAEDGFSVSAPSKPDFQKVSQGTLENHNYTINLDGNRSVLISVTDTQAKPTLARAKAGFVKKLNLKITSEKEITLAEYPGIEFEGQSEQWRTRARFYVVKGTILQLISMGPASVPVAPETDRIFDSLKLLSSPPASQVTPAPSEQAAQPAALAPAQTNAAPVQEKLGREAGSVPTFTPRPWALVSTDSEGELLVKGYIPIWKLRSSRTIAGSYGLDAIREEMILDLTKRAAARGGDLVRTEWDFRPSGGTGGEYTEKADVWRLEPELALLFEARLKGDSGVEKLVAAEGLTSLLLDMLREHSTPGSARVPPPASQNPATGSLAPSAPTVSDSSVKQKPALPDSAAQLKQAADAGDAAAQYRLGLMYRDGVGVSKDSDQAKKWLRMAADAQLPEAQYELARMLDRPNPRDSQWLSGILSPKKPSDRQGQTNVEEDKQRLEKEQAQWEKDQVEARSWYQAAAQNGNVEAQFKLASRLEKQDRIEALKWLYLVNSYCRNHMETAFCFDDFQPLFFQLKAKATNQETIEAQRRADNVRKK